MKTFLMSALLTAMMLSGCATIVNGRKQQIGINSKPVDSECKIDSNLAVKTPAVIQLKRSKSHIVMCEKPGYEQASQTITSHVSGWLLGNLVIGGPIGMLVDVITGGAWKLKPESVDMSLAPNVAAVENKK